MQAQYENSQCISTYAGISQNYPQLVISIITVLTWLCYSQDAERYSCIDSILQPLLSMV